MAHGGGGDGSCRGISAPPPCFSALRDTDRPRADVQTKAISSLSPATKGRSRNQEVESVAKAKRIFDNRDFVAPESRSEQPGQTQELKIVRA